MVVKPRICEETLKNVQIELLVEDDGNIVFPWHDDFTDELIARIGGEIVQGGPKPIPGLPHLNLCG